MAGMKKGKHPNMPGHKVENPGKLLGRVMACLLYTSPSPRDS